MSLAWSAISCASGRGIVLRARGVRVRARTSSICCPSRSSASRADARRPPAHSCAPWSSVACACSTRATNLAWSDPRSRDDLTSASSASSRQPIHSKLGSIPHGGGSVVVVELLAGARDVLVVLLVELTVLLVDVVVGRVVIVDVVVGAVVEVVCSVVDDVVVVVGTMDVDVEVVVGRTVVGVVVVVG